MKTLQKGQALTEFLVLALALIPLFLLIPLIAKYQDIGHAAKMGSRYAAFDATIHNDLNGSGFKSAGDLAQEVRRRFFSHPDAPLKTGDAAGDFKAHQNLFWRDPNDQPLIEKMENIHVQQQPWQDIHAGRLVFFLSSHFHLKDPPLYKGKVTVPVLNMPGGISAYRPFDAINLKIERETVVMIGDWAAQNPGDVNNKVNAAQRGVHALGKGNATLGNFYVPFDLFKVLPPKVGKLERWEDLVPADRLKPKKD